jgi:hypothetical protein
MVADGHFPDFDSRDDWLLENKYYAHQSVSLSMELQTAEVKQKVLGRINHLLSFHCNFSIWYDK